MKFKTLVKLALSACTTATLFSLSTITAFAAEANNTAAAGGTGLGGMLLSFGIIILFMYFVMIRPQKKKEKETKSMQDNIQVGDEVVTIGGIVGMVVRKGDDNVVIETGGERNKLRIKLWAISENTTANERKAAENDSAKPEKKSKKKDDVTEE